MTASSTSVVVVHEETIKPSSPTPSHLRTFKLSLLDQFYSPHYTPTLFFYAASPPSGSGGGGGVLEAEKTVTKSLTLKKSLSQTLTRFYPFSGRRTSADTPTINCNDEGVPYLEARANFPMSDVFQDPKHEELLQFVPTGGRLTDLEIDLMSPLVIIQVTFFECGGIAICLCLSHKVGDAVTIHTFVSAWAKAASSGQLDAVVPDLTAAAARFPAQCPFPLSAPPPNRKKQDEPAKHIITRRYVFGASKLKSLKALASSTTVPKPTRAEAVSALVWRCSINAARRSGGGSSPRKSSSFLAQPVDIRSRLTPPLGNLSLGNIVVPVVANTVDNYELPVLVSQLREQLQQLLKDAVSKLDGEERSYTIMNLYINLLKQMIGTTHDAYWYQHSSICGLNFYEPVDFGWGRPAWMTTVLPDLLNRVMLMNTSCGEGVEAWVTLVQEEMDLLEHDPEFIEFASVNPCPLLDHHHHQENKNNRPLSSAL